MTAKKYTKKNIEVRALQYAGFRSIPQVVSGLNGIISSIECFYDGHIVVKTKLNSFSFEPNIGDWLVVDDIGTFSCISVGDFLANYEEVK